jgi:hypothetical protein
MVHLVKRWTICGVYADLQMALTVKHFAPNNFPTCVQRKLFQLMNKILQTPSYLFSVPKLQVTQITAFFLTDSVYSLS